MAIGYACLTTGVPNTGLGHCILRNATASRLTELVEGNLVGLITTLAYNRDHAIRFFRISSDLIPFASRSDLEHIPWADRFADRFDAIGKIIADNDMRITMHPGQYTVLNSPDPHVVEQALADLRYHGTVLDALHLDTRHKLVLHIGGAYGDKKAAANRFVSHFRHLDRNIRNRLILENDDRLFTIGEVLEIASKTGSPVVYDNLHHRINPCPGERSERQWLEEAQATWKEQDGKQIIHYSQQAANKNPGAHSKTIAIAPFIAFFQDLPDRDIDIMLEVKDKNASAVKCIHCIEGASPEALQRECERYLPSIAERSPTAGKDLAHIVEKGGKSEARVLYTRVERLLSLPVDAELARRTVRKMVHDIPLSPEEAKRFDRLLARQEEGAVSPASLKNRLERLAIDHRRNDILFSYYFTF